MRNGRAAASVLVGLLALADLAGAAAAARFSSHVGFREAVAGIPVGLVLSVLAIRLGRQGTERYQRTLGRAGGRTVAAAGRVLGTVALVVSVTAVLAVAVYGVLSVLLD